MSAVCCLMLMSNIVSRILMVADGGDCELKKITHPIVYIIKLLTSLNNNNNNNNRRLVTLAEHTSDHGKQTNSSTKEKGEHG